jgi:hypothetical protein
MEEEVNQKTVALVVNTSKMTASVLKHAIEKKLQSDKQKRIGRKNAAVVKKQNQVHKGKMSVKEVVSSGSGVSNIELADSNIKSFERIASKYGLDFSLKKDKSREPPRYIVFFRGKDTDVINQAFKEFVAKQTRSKDKPSIKKRLQHYKDVVAKRVVKSRSKTKDMER